MRCLILVDELKKWGAQIRFISRNLSPHLIEMLNLRGVEHVSLSAYSTQESTDALARTSWLGSSQTQDAKADLQAVADQSWDWNILM